MRLEIERKGYRSVGGVLEREHGLEIERERERETLTVKPRHPFSGTVI